jgi:hypothetical protein
VAEGALDVDAAWGLAVAIGLMPDEEQDRPALDELADAMLVWADEEALDAVTTKAVEQVWGDELAGEIRAPLDLLTADDYWAADARRALEELDRVGPASAIARAVVQFVAQQLGNLDQGFSFCLCCLDELVQRLPASGRRAATVQAAVVAVRDVAVPEDEVRDALRQHPVDRGAVVRVLATDERRRAARRRLGQLGRLAARSMPVLAVELAALAEEEPPKDAGDDPVWLTICKALLDEEVRPELN